MMKVAFPTNDGTTIYPHFGRAQYYLVISLDDNGVEIGREKRAKPHHTASGHHHDHEHNHNGHGHRGMLAPAADCQVMIAGGMGQPAYYAIQQAGLQAILTRERDINKALAAFLNSTLENDLRLVHQPHHRH